MFPMKLIFVHTIPIIGNPLFSKGVRAVFIIGSKHFLKNKLLIITPCWIPVEHASIKVTEPRQGRLLL